MKGDVAQSETEQGTRSWALLHALALLFLLLGLDCRMEYFLVADFWKLWVNLVHCCTAELAVCENEFPAVLEAQRLVSGSDGLKHNSNKSTTGGMIPESFTPTILPDAYFDILASSPTISFTGTYNNILIIKCVFQNTMIVKKILMRHLGISME